MREDPHEQSTISASPGAPRPAPAKRRLVVPEAVAAPLLITRHNCDPLLGWTRQQFLQFLRQHREVPRICLGEAKRGEGRLIAVLVDDLRVALRGLASAPGPYACSAAAESPDDDDALGNDHPLTADAVLRELGRRRVRGAR